MSFLTIGGTAVSIADDAVDREDVPVGEVRPAFSGAPRSAVRAYQTRWKLKTIPLARATADTVRGLLEASPPLTLAGDLTGSTTGYLAGSVMGHSKTLADGSECVVLSFELWES